MVMTDLASVQITVRGRVQGVYFRGFTVRHARELGLTGYARNMPDRKTVEVHAEGERDKLEQLVKHLRAGPPAARVEEVITDWSEYTGSYSDFKIGY